MGEEKLEVATRLVFVPAAGREETDPLNLHEEVFVNHRGVFLDIGQFAVYVAKILVPYGKPLPIVAGWQDRDFVPDQGTSILIAKSLVEYCKMQWELFASRQVRQGGETAGADREVRLPLASEVQPAMTTWAAMDGARITATPGTGTSVAAGTGAGAERDKWFHLLIVA